MPVWRVRGGNALNGEAEVQGAKNAVLPIMAASLLCAGETVLNNCPTLLDVAASIDILRHLGCRARQEGGRIWIDASAVSETHIPHALMQRSRSSVMFLGAILARTGEVRLSTPGGCELGSRPIDLHLKALKELGAEIIEEGGEVCCRAGKLKGAHVHLELPSVGATENVMLAACAAEGTTVITNAAREPEIVDLADYLKSAGRRVGGAGTPTVTVSGGEAAFPGGAVYSVMPDRIVAATWLCAAAAAGGDVLLHGVSPEHVATVLCALREMGCAVVAGRNDIRLRRIGALRAPRPVVTKPYPGFPTDAQALLMAACLRAEGTSVFVENIFDNRYRHVPELRRLGAEIRTEGRVAMLSGVPRLMGAPVTATDLRGGAALVVAGLSAEGETEVYDSGHIRRGYDGLDEVLRRLGAEISVEEKGENI